MQLELDLWNDLDKAAVSPVELDLNALLDKLDQMVASLEGDRKLALAGETLDQLAGVWQIRTEEMLLDWRDRFEGARLADDWLGALYQPPDAFNVAEFEIPLLGVRKPRTKVPIDGETLVEEVDKGTLLAWVDERKREISTMEEEVQLAHEESIQAWAEAIARVLERHEGKATLQTLCDESEVGEERRSGVGGGFTRMSSFPRAGVAIAGRWGVLWEVRTDLGQNRRERLARTDEITGGCCDDRARSQTNCDLDGRTVRSTVSGQS